ncbi:MAG TPA: mannosyltransferase family protein [Anaeromyxobacteraceae bacterium]|nr:mannosyltransferase family protein [Anaeromyxobacteraceae bacterium]
MKPAQRVVVAALATRALVHVAAVAGTRWPRPERLVHAAPDGHRYLFSPVPALDALARWDSAFYLRIAAQGYVAPPSGAPHDAAFFPLYPWLLGALQRALGLDPVLAGLAVSAAAFALGVAATYRLLADVAGEEEAADATVLLLAFPGSLFLSAVYTESLFLALSAGALLAARRGRLGAAGALAALAALTRPNGVLLVLPVGVEAFLAWRRGARVLPGALALLLPPLALAAHAARLGRAYGDPLAFAHVQAQWGRGLAPPWRAFLAFNQDPEHYLVAFGGLAALWSAWRARRQPASLQLHAALALIVPICTGSLKSLPRFAGVAFPLFQTAARWTRWRAARVAWLAVSLGLLAWWSFRFGRGDGVN